MTTVNPTTMNTVAMTTATMTSAVGMFTNLFSNVTLINVLLIVGTIGGQSILKKLSFSCPCAFPLNVYQSLMFILGPSFGLFIAGIMLKSTTWRLVHGCFYRHPDTRHNIKTACVHWIEVLVQASVAPAVWLFVAFLDGSYYRCLLSGRFCHLETARACKNVTEPLDAQSFQEMSGGGIYCPQCLCSLDGPDATYLESTSNVIAWALLLCYGTCAFMIVCCVRMCDKYTMLQRKYVETYKSEETSKFDAVAKEHAAQIADNNARAFFSNKDWSKKDWDWVSGVSEISNPFFARMRMIETEKTRTTLYTPLQLWSSHNGYKILKPDVDVPSAGDEDN